MDFDYTRPFQTKDGRPARLLGIIHSITPLVVAVKDKEKWGRETVVQYPRHGLFDGFDALSLVNVDYEDHNLKCTDFVHAVVVEEKDPMDLSKSANPFNYDGFSMGTQLVRGWVAMHDGYDRLEEPFPLQRLDLVNTRSGQWIKINLMTKKV